jgi:hypothetical protein
LVLNSNKIATDNEEVVMKRTLISAVLALALVCISPLYLAADNVDVPQPKQLPKQAEMSIPGYTIALFSNVTLDGDLFFQVLATDGSENPETISEKIDVIRLSAYPDQEIRLAITLQRNVQDTTSADNKKLSFAGRIALVKSLYWWNTEKNYMDYWIHCETASAAANFTNVENGSYYVFRYRNSEWVHQTNSPFSAPHTTAQTTFGYPDYRCFGGVGGDTYNKADVVMYFYDYVPENMGPIF